VLTALSKSASGSAACRHVAQPKPIQTRSVQKDDQAAEPQSSYAETMAKGDVDESDPITRNAAGAGEGLATSYGHMMGEAVAMNAPSMAPQIRCVAG